MSEHAGNCDYVQKGTKCDCGLWDQSATSFKHQERIRELEAALRSIVQWQAGHGTVVLNEHDFRGLRNLLGSPPNATPDDGAKGFLEDAAALSDAGEAK